MLRCSSLQCSLLPFSPNSRKRFPEANPLIIFKPRADSSSTHVNPDVSNSKRSNDKSRKPVASSCKNTFCLCGRRRFIEAAFASFFPIFPSSYASDSPSDYTAVLKRVHPPRPDWYEEFYASVLNTSMKAYEAEIAGYKSQLFANLKGKAEKVLEIGIGTGPNLRYYAGDNGIQVFGVDPNRKMEKYSMASAISAGLPVSNFKFIQAVGEAIPLRDASVDAIVGTLVLCSVNDVNMTLKEVKRVLRPGGFYLFVEHVAAEDGTILKFMQKALDPLQQTVADGCHLTRDTGKNIFEAGFSDLQFSMAFLSNASLINPHIYGMASK